MKLYARIWLAVVATIAAFTLIVGMFVQRHTEHLQEQFRTQNLESSWRDGSRGDQRELEIRDQLGRIVGHAVRYREPVDVASGPTDIPPRTRGFSVRMDSGQQFDIALPPRPPRPLRPEPPWYFSPWGVFGMLGLMALAVGLGAYPIVRRLTKRVETLQHGVEQWGEGRLSVRVPVEGSDEIAFLAQKFNHAAAQVETLVSAHKSLLANASHELRSPLARIRMAIALLQATPDKASEATSQEINRNIKELDDLIEEILLASRLDSPDASMGTTESFDLMGLAAEECARVNAELMVDDGALGTFEMIGYPKLIRRLLRNLLENAQRHNHSERGTVSLALTSAGNQLVITIRDHGAGVPNGEAEKIFEPFYRARNASERDGGVGLGLALVKSIALRHKGEAKCVSMQGVGGCFIVRLAAQV